MDGSATLDRIDAQLAILATLTPGTNEHREATNVLLLLRDSLHIHRQIDTLLAALKLRS